jgi:hypothetical protein
MKNVVSLLLSSALLAVFVVGCDSVGSEETAILNADSPAPPTVEYEFRYTSDDVSSDGEEVEVVSEGGDNLGSVLTQNGFSRDDVTSARVDSVTLRRQSSPTSSGVQPKVFDYLSGAALFLGTDASGKRIAEDQFNTTQRKIRLGIANSNVTTEVKTGSTRAFLRLTASDQVPEEDVVDVTVYYRIEVQGV